MIESKRLKLKPFVIPTIYILAIGTIILSIILIGQTIRDFNNLEVDVTYVTNTVVDDEGVPVVELKNTKVIKPFTDEGVTVVKYFYEKDATEEQQQNSLIFYQGTYMQNTGILYRSDNEFNVIAVMDGRVANIKEDNILGFVIEIEHNSKLTTIYQSLGEVKVKVGDVIRQGDIIGVSGPNNILPENKFSLLFEVNHNGRLINPNNFFNTDIKIYSEE